MREELAERAAGGETVGIEACGRRIGDETQSAQALGLGGRGRRRLAADTLPRPLGERLGDAGGGRGDDHAEHSRRDHDLEHAETRLRPAPHRHLTQPAICTTTECGVGPSSVKLPARGDSCPAAVGHPAATKSTTPPG